MVRRTMVLPLIVGLVLVLGSAALAQVFPLGLLPLPPATDDPVEVYVWTTESQFYVGDPIEIYLSTNRPAFVYLFDLQPDGVVRLLFPNAFSSGNYLPGTALRLPDGAYNLLAQPPTGIEELLAFATLEPLPFPTGSPAEPFPLIAESPQEAIDQLVGLLTMMDPTQSWAVAWTALQILGTGAAEPEPAEPTPPDVEPVVLPPLPPMPPFVGTPGVSWYTLAGAWYQGIPSAGWYWHFGLDQRWHLSWVYEP